MHSSKKIEEAYPGYGDAIRELYTGSYNDRPLSRNRTVTKMLNSVIYDDFINVTSNEFIIFGCRYMNTGCLKNWTMEFTRFGKCAVFNPDVDTIGEKTAVGRKASLSIVVGYNQSDANVGWYSFLSGVTMYYSSPSESFLDPLNSLSLPPETVPMLSVVQVILFIFKIACHWKCWDSSKNAGPTLLDLRSKSLEFFVVLSRLHRGPLSSRVSCRCGHRCVWLHSPVSTSDSSCQKVYLTAPLCMHIQSKLMYFIALATIYSVVETIWV